MYKCFHCDDNCLSFVKHEYFSFWGTFSNRHCVCNTRTESKRRHKETLTFVSRGTMFRVVQDNQNLCWPLATANFNESTDFFHIFVAINSTSHNVFLKMWKICKCCWQQAKPTQAKVSARSPCKWTWKLKQIHLPLLRSRGKQAMPPRRLGLDAHVEYARS